MHLTPEQQAQYERDGYVIFPDLLSREEVEILRAENRRLCAIEDEHVVREHTGAARTVFRVHDDKSPTASAAYFGLARLPRLMAPAVDVLGDDDVYVYHSKMNVKDAIEGTVWLWHQDYGYWQYDGVPEPNMTTFMVMLDEATEINGCLYLLPGSHELGIVEPERDTTTTSYPQWAIPRDRLVPIMERCPEPVPAVGPPGTGVMFDCRLLHGSGHNMSRHPRWQIYMVYTPVSNAPRAVENPRPEWVRSVKNVPLEVMDDDAILRVAQAAE